MKTWLFVALMALLLAPTVAQAQTVSTSTKLIWTAPSNATLAEVQAFEYRFRDNNGAFLAVPNVTCASMAADGCTAPLSAAMVTMLNAFGTHNVTLSAYSTVGLVESPQSLPFVLKSLPVAPTGLRLTP